MIRRAILIALLLALTGCSGVQGLDLDWRDAVQLEGDVRCEGEGALHVLGIVHMYVEGTAGVQGELATESGEACAGVRLTFGRWQWSIASSTQDRAECAGIAGSIMIRDLDGVEPDATLDVSQLDAETVKRYLPSLE